MHVPHTSLQPATLRALIEEFVLRDGTEYGDREVSLDEKVAAVMTALERGDAVILYDAESESCSIASRR